MDIVKQKFGERLKTIRKIHGFTQEKLAEKIGINLRQLARIEAGESFISSETLFNICFVLKISPSLLFDFDILDDILMAGKDEIMHFKVINNDDLIYFIPKNIKNLDNKNNIKSLDEKMKRLAIKYHKKIILDELQDEVADTTKIFKPSGEIEIKNNKNILFEDLKNKINSISNDSKKLEFLNTAFNSLTNKNVLNELKILIKGIELTIEN